MQDLTRSPSDLFLKRAIQRDTCLKVGKELASFEIFNMQ